MTMELTNGDDLRKARWKAGLSQRQLAELVGLREGTIRFYEAGRLPIPIKRKAFIAQALELAQEKQMAELKAAITVINTRTGRRGPIPAT